MCVRVHEDVTHAVGHLGQIRNAFESLLRVMGVMQDSMAVHDVECARRKRRREDRRLDDVETRVVAEMVLRLVDANTSNKADALDEVGGLLSQLASAWTEIRSATKAETPVEGA